jgi:hypothetical protein
MLLSSTDRALLEEACANRHNEKARSLLNVFGASTAAEIIDHITSAPAAIRTDLIDEVLQAINDQRRFRQR